MTAQYFSVFTEQGLSLLREAIQNGTKLGITKMSFGDGGGSLPYPDATFTQLVNEVYETQLNSLAPDPNNSNWLRAEAVISSAVGGFNIRELGLWADDILVAYSNYPPTYKPNPSDGTARIMTFRMVLQIDNTANFELKIDADIVMATIRTVEEAKQSAMEYSDMISKQRVLHVNSISDLLNITGMSTNDTAYVKAFYEPNYSLEKPFYGGHGYFIYDESKSEDNNGVTIFNGWVRQITDKTYTPQMAGGTDKMAMDKLLAVIPEYSTIYLENGDYDFTGLEILKNGIRVLGESKEKTLVTAKADPVTGVFLRCGKRGPSSDYRNDNLPVYNGTLRHWDESQYSPATPNYPRYSDIRIDNITLILSDANGIGTGTGLDFYRINGGGFDLKVKWASNFSFGNGIRVHFCKDLDIPFLEIEENTNSTYSMLYYWSYGLKGGKWKIGSGNVLAVDFKHSVNGKVDDLEAYGRNVIGVSAVNVGYGSINNHFGKITAINGDVTLKSAVEFDMIRDTVIGELYIDSPETEGLCFVRAEGFNLTKYHIRAKIPISGAMTEFFTFSNAPDIGIAANRSTGEFKFDGNYFTTANESGYTKYFEQRPLPVLKNAQIGKGKLIIPAGATYGIQFNVAGSMAETMDEAGKLRTFDSISNRGYQENLRNQYTYKKTFPHAVEDVDFGDVEFITEPGANLTSYIRFSSPTHKCKGSFLTDGDALALKSLFMFDCNFKIENRKPRAQTSSYLFELNSAVRSTIDGIFRTQARVGNFIGGSSLYYTDGFSDLTFKGKIIFPTAPIGTPIFATNYSASVDTWKPLNLDGLKIYAEDGSNTNTAAVILRHLGSFPVGVDFQNGSGYICNDSCIQDNKTPFRRLFTDSNAENPPSFLPNKYGELALNTTTGIWWKSTFANWSKI